jgi:hypothetical protein
MENVIVHRSVHAEDDRTASDFQTTNAEMFRLIRASATLDWLKENRGNLHFTWRMSFPWSRDQYTYPVGGLDQPHAKPANGPVFVYTNEPGVLEPAATFRFDLLAKCVSLWQWHAANRHTITTIRANFGTFYGTQWTRAYS